LGGDWTEILAEKTGCLDRVVMKSREIVFFLELKDLFCNLLEVSRLHQKGGKSNWFSAATKNVKKIFVAANWLYVFIC
jgi:hypothetical protein